MAKSKEVTTTELVIEKMQTAKAGIWIKGMTPLIYNAMSFKAKGEIMYPKGKKTTAEKARTIKHNPAKEYVDSTYKRIGEGPTLLILPTIMFKASMANAALEIPGAKKSQIGRLVWVCEQYTNLYGVPKMLMSVTRSADMNKTPDIRTRAIVPEWCCKITLQYVSPPMNDVAIARLLETAGLIIGVGDFRQEKGKGNYGQFQICEEKDVAHIVKSGGRKAQEAAFKDIVCHDVETQELYDWYCSERKNRGQ